MEYAKSARNGRACPSRGVQRLLAVGLAEQGSCEEGDLSQSGVVCSQAAESYRRAERDTIPAVEVKVA